MTAVVQPETCVPIRNHIDKIFQKQLSLDFQFQKQLSLDFHCHYNHTCQKFIQFIFLEPHCFSGMNLYVCLC
jgi:hypothetical protein